MDELYDILIIGGGPCGSSVAIEATKSKLTHLILEKGNLTESIRNYPRRMRFFSTAENIEIGGIPFPVSDVKATRTEALQYYRKVAGFYKLSFRLFSEVSSIRSLSAASQTLDTRFEVTTTNGTVYSARKVVIATGYFDVARRLNIPGEDLPQVSHYYDEPFKYSFTKVIIIGGGNSAIEAALELYRHDVDVTIIHRGEELRQTVKYWLIPDIKNRIKEGKIKAIFQTIIKEVTPTEAVVENIVTGEETRFPANFVFFLTGYLPDSQLLLKAGIFLNEELVPQYDTRTFETNVKGLYLAGTVLAGIHTEKVFIENGRHHAQAIIDHITNRPVRPVKDLIMRI